MGLRDNSHLLVQEKKNGVPVLYWSTANSQFLGGVKLNLTQRLVLVLKLFLANFQLSTNSAFLMLLLLGLASALVLVLLSAQATTAWTTLHFPFLL
jgi:hypothetical protein